MLFRSEKITQAALEKLHAIAQERDRLRGEVAVLKKALRDVQEWERNLTPEAGIKYGSYFPAFAINQALAAVPADARGERERAVIAAAMAWARTFRDVQWARKFGEAVTPLMEGALYQASCTLEDVLSEMRPDAPPAGRKGGE